MWLILFCTRLSIDVTEDFVSSETDDHDSDEDYEPSVNITLG